MEEIKAWVIGQHAEGKANAQPLERVEQTKTEHLLEEILVGSPDLLGADIKLIGRQADTPGGPLDLLGVDGDGRLVVFELKRGTLTREAVAQVVDYASYLAELEATELSSHIVDRSGKFGIDKIGDFAAWYHEQYAKTLPSFMTPRMVLVGLGTDDRTRRMVSFLADSDIDITLVTFHAFQDNDGVLLTRKIEVEARPPVITGGGTKQENLAKLKELAIQLGVASHYHMMAKTFREALSAYEWPNATGFSYYLADETETGSQSNRVYASLYLRDNRPGKIQVYLHPRAVEVAKDDLDRIFQDISLKVKERKDGSLEIWVSSEQAWQQNEKLFREVCTAIYEGWKRKRDHSNDVGPETPETDAPLP